jgi:glycosyltransferase involved in cell wall biosynthesis
MFRNGKNCDKPCLDCRALRMSHAQASEQVTAVVGVSRFVLDRLLNAGYFSEAPIREVLYNFGTSVPSELPPKQRAPRLRLGFIGFLAESKGIEWLLRTFKESRLSDVELLIAGRGEEQYEKGLRERYGDADDIKFLGFIKPADFFAQVDVAIVPSLWNDTLPSVVFESLGYGVPVVGSRRGGIPEMVLDGVNGLVFEPDDPASLVSAIVKLRDDPALLSSLRSACRPSSAKFYDVQGWAAGQEEIFRRARQHADSRAVPA